MDLFTPIQYLKIDVASKFGLDKENWDDRLAWFDANEADLDDLVKTAEEPALFFAGVQAYRKAKAGEAIGYPISLDATASGAQLLAILVGCKKSAMLCNVIDTGRREDLYTNIYRMMCDTIGDTAKIKRKDTKRAIMTSLYSSRAVPKQVFGEGELLEVFNETMGTEAPGIWKLNWALLGLWRPDVLAHSWVLPDNFHVDIKVMDRHYETAHFLNRPYEIVSKVNRPMEEGRSIGANTIHSIDGMIVREMGRRCSFDLAQKARVMELVLSSPSHISEEKPVSLGNHGMVKKLLAHHKASGFLSARIIEHIDESSIQLLDTEQRELVWELLESMPEKPFPLLSVHDCFRVHPNYGNDLRRQYNRILHEIARSNMLAFIASQITGHETTVEKFDDIADQILTANYALS